MKRIIVIFILLWAFATPKRLSVRTFNPTEFIEDTYEDNMLDEVVEEVKAQTLEILLDFLNGEEFTKEEEELLEEINIDDDFEYKIEDAIDQIEEDEGAIIDGIEEVADDILSEEINEYDYELEEDVEFEEEEEDSSIINEIAEDVLDLNVDELTENQIKLLNENAVKKNEVFEEYIEDDTAKKVEIEAGKEEMNVIIEVVKEELKDNVINILEDYLHGEPPKTKDEKKLIYSFIDEEATKEEIREDIEFFKGDNAILDKGIENLIMEFLPEEIDEVTLDKNNHDYTLVEKIIDDVINNPEVETEEILEEKSNCVTPDGSEPECRCKCT